MSAGRAKCERGLARIFGLGSPFFPRQTHRGNDSAIVAEKSDKKVERERERKKNEIAISNIQILPVNDLPQLFLFTFKIYSVSFSLHGLFRPANCETEHGQHFGGQNNCLIDKSFQAGLGNPWLMGPGGEPEKYRGET